MLVLIFGLWRLQVVGAQNYRAMAQANRVRKVPILAARGQLFDREGRLLVDNYPPSPAISCASKVTTSSPTCRSSRAAST